MTGLITVLSNSQLNVVPTDRLREIAKVGGSSNSVEAPIPPAGGLRIQRLSSRFSADQLDTIIRRYEQGDSATAIASDYEVAPSALIRLLRERGVVVRKGTVSIEQAKQMAQEYEAGACLADASDSACVTVGKRACKHRVALRFLPGR